MSVSPSMAETLLQFAASNLVIALPLAFVAWAVQHFGKRPELAHLLWLVVLVKLVTPPVVSLPVSLSVVEPLPAAIPSTPAGAADDAAHVAGMAAVESLRADPARAQGSGGASLGALTDWPTAVVGLWLVGSALVLVFSLTRAVCFDRLLRATSTRAGPALQDAAARIAGRLGVVRQPDVLTTAATISPMVWCLGGRARIFIPQRLVDKMSDAELASILTHEIGHVGRGDHLVRWLEWLACIALWWNPVAWWARRNLRICEEICCDAFVLSKTETSRDAYARALVNATELLAGPTIRPPRLASRANGGSMERRITMVLSGRSIRETPRWLKGAVLAAAALIAPLGFTVAQEPDETGGLGQWIEAGLDSGSLTEQDAWLMLGSVRVAFGEDRVRIVRQQGDAPPDRLAQALEDAIEEATRRVFARRFVETRLEPGDLSLEDGERLVAVSFRWASPTEERVVLRDRSGRRIVIARANGEAE